jgi:hypothetical protein
MNRPPAPGAHAYYRPLAPPCPTGVNDHGDPGHVRREGPTPGPLGWNDHAMPLSQRERLMVDPEHPTAMHPIDEIIARVDAGSPDASLQEKLKLCAAAVAAAAMNPEGSTRLPGPIDRCTHAYFLARRQAFEGALDVAQTGGDPAPSGGHGTKASATGPRETGEYFRPIGWERAPEAPPSLSYQRVMRSTNDEFLRVEEDPVRFWADKGWADGLRDRSANDDRLRSYPHATWMR